MLVERGAVKEVLREFLFEIPGFRALKRGISAEVIATPDPPQGESASCRSELAVTARPPEVAPDPARLSGRAQPPGRGRAQLPERDKVHPLGCDLRARCK